MSRSRVIVLLLDIDGTLLTAKSNRVHEAAFSAAVHHYTEQTVDISEVDHSGRTDRGILTQLLAVAGKLSVPDHDIDHLLDYMAEYVQKRSAELSPIVIDGVVPFLQRIRSINSASLDSPLPNTQLIPGLVTGNVKEIAMEKLKAAGILNYFDSEVYGFGEEDLVRSNLIRNARERAERCYIDEVDRVVVIGDTPRDVEAAREAGAEVIAVCTGKFTRQQLEQTHPDLLLDSLRQLDAVLQFLQR